MSENSSDYKSALHVQNGIEQPVRINPYLNRNSLKKKVLTLDKDEYTSGILSKNRIVLSKAITLIESNLHEHYALAQEIINACIPYSGNSVRIGISGVPGAGKSTFIESFGTYITSLGHNLAVLAIDPSSELSKGSILGDKTRMEQLSVNPKAFIRPSPSAGSLGGVTRKTRESIILCEAAGFDTIIVETVGVGQSETAVHSMVDFFLLLTISGAGDELQGIKRGIMEIANAVVVNKADGDNVHRAELSKTQLVNALRLFPNHNRAEWKTPVFTASSIEGKSIPEIWKCIQQYVNLMKNNGWFDKKRIIQSDQCLKSYIEERLFDMFYSNENVKNRIETIRQKMFNQQISAYKAGSELLETYMISLEKQNK